MVLTFNEENGRQLAASLLQTEPNSGPDWSELEQSALMETGNILGCAYVNAITRLIDHQLVPTPPFFYATTAPAWSNKRWWPSRLRATRC